MKAETKPTKSFKQILEAIGKTSESQLKEHWKQIRPQTGNDKKKEDESAGKAEAKKAEGLAKAAEAKSRKEGAVKVDGSSKKVSIFPRGRSSSLKPPSAVFLTPCITDQHTRPAKTPKINLPP